MAMLSAARKERKREKETGIFGKQSTVYYSDYKRGDAEIRNRVMASTKSNDSISSHQTTTTKGERSVDKI